MIKRAPITPVEIGNYDIPPDEFKKVELEFEKVFDTKLPLTYRIKSFIRGENKAGRTIGMVLDGLSLIFPRMRTARNLAQHVLIKKQKKMDKPKHTSKTIWGVAILCITGILDTLGVQFVNDPELMRTIYEVIYYLSGAFGLYGLRDAIGKQINETKKLK